MHLEPYVEDNSQIDNYKYYFGASFFQKKADYILSHVYAKTDLLFHPLAMTHCHLVSELHPQDWIHCQSQDLAADYLILIFFTLPTPLGMVPQAIFRCLGGR